MSKVPRTDVLNYMAKLRETPETDDGATADEDAMPRGSGWTGRGSPLQIGWYVGSGCCVRDFCDGQADMITDLSKTFGTMELLVNLAMGRIKDSPFPVEAVRSLKNRIISGFPLGRHEEDRPDPPVDFRFLDQLMREESKVGSGVRFPRLPELYRPKRR